MRQLCALAAMGLAVSVGADPTLCWKPTGPSYPLCKCNCEPGDVGQQGPQGLQGGEGPQGVNGDSVKGPTGPPGPQGPDGIEGQQGPQGPDGDQGSPGPAGADGDRGKMGKDGPDGDDGPDGSQGPVGDMGPVGNDGADGQQGLDGAEGPAGGVGPKGQIGNAGSTGSVGPQGATGNPGPSGIVAEGRSTPFNNVQPFGVVNYIIAISGTFPSRNEREASTLGLSEILGDISMFAGTFAPANYAFCDGQLLPINNNQGLFSLLGTTYGGNGRTTFGLPDLRSRVPIHRGQGAGLTNRRLGSFGGEETHTLEINEMPRHDHF